MERIGAERALINMYTHQKEKGNRLGTPCKETH